MKTSMTVRVAALLFSVVTTFLTVQAIADYGLPADGAPQMAQAAASAVR